MEAFQYVELSHVLHVLSFHVLKSFHARVAGIKAACAANRAGAAVRGCAAADLDGLVPIVKRKLKKIQYRPHLIDGCLAATGLTLQPW